MDTTEIIKLREAIDRNTRAFNSMVENLNRQASPWCSPEEAADILGIQKTKSGNHRRRLSRAVRLGLIEKVRPGKQPCYWRQEIRELAVKLAQNEIVI